MTGEFCGTSLFRGFPAFQRPTEARGKERHLRKFEIPGYRRGHNIPEASLEPPYHYYYSSDSIDDSDGSDESNGGDGSDE